MARDYYNALPVIPATVLMAIAGGGEAGARNPGERPPNILFAISDDQSFPHASAYGSIGLSTPTFDALAKEGVLFMNAFVAAPQSSPSRAAILTGRNIWQLGAAGTHGSLFPREYQVFTDALEASGYAIGYTGKAWAPGNWKQSGWNRNPVGPEYNQHRLKKAPPYSGISNIDYGANFVEFIESKEKSAPFFFWFGSNEPHRVYEYGSGVQSGKSLSEVHLPAFLPEEEVIRNDILDYYTEIEWFDKQLGEMVRYLEEIEELDNTIIVVTSDNGMAFPYAKANLYEFGTHVPLLISGKMFFDGNREIDDLVSLIDLAPTFLELASTPILEGVTGKSLAPLLHREKQPEKNEERDFVLTGRERHSHARPDNLGYPSRAIRTKDFLYIKNYKADRWPAGDPANDSIPEIIDSKDSKPIGSGYADIDDSPTKEWMIENSQRFPGLFQKAFDHRPEEELYHVTDDPYCLVNLAGEEKYSDIKAHLKALMENELEKQGDPRIMGNGDIFESYPRFGLMRNFPGFKERGVFNEKYMVKDSEQ